MSKVGQEVRSRKIDLCGGHSFAYLCLCNPVRRHLMNDGCFAGSSSGMQELGGASTVRAGGWAGDTLY